jgi:hypothetical protein
MAPDSYLNVVNSVHAPVTSWLTLGEGRKDP